MNIITKRILAFFIDNLIIVFIFSLLNSIVNLEYGKYDIEIFNVVWKIIITPIIFFYLIYFILFDAFNDGITIGKRIFRIKIDAKENKLIKRSIVKSLSYLLLPFTLIFWVILGKLPQDYFMKTVTKTF